MLCLHSPKVSSSPSQIKSSNQNKFPETGVILFEQFY